jgi:xanthine/uracil permease
LQPTHKARVSSPWGRLKLAGAGLILAGVGIALLLRDIQVVRHWTGQPLFSSGLVAGGVLCIVLAIIPGSWIARAAETKREKANHLR